jgi:hypothetical protein
VSEPLSRHRWSRLAQTSWPYAIPLLVLALEWRLLTPVPAVADHFQFWAAGHLAATGRSPYDREAWEAMAALGPIPGGVAISTIQQNLDLTKHLWLYPPQMSFALVPFGALPVEVGVPLLHLFVLATAAIGVALSAHVAGLFGSRLAFALTLAAVSGPFVVGVRDGHPIGLLLGGMALVFLGLRDRRWWMLALGVAIVSLKPQLAVIFGLAALAYIVLRRDREAFAVAGLTLAAVTVPAAVLHPFPFSALAEAPAERIVLDLSTTGALARDLGGGTPLTVVLWIVAFGAAVVAMRAPRRGLRGAVPFALVLGLSLVVLPYVHHYDQLLILSGAFTAHAVPIGTRRELPIAAAVAVVVAVVPWILFLWWPLQGQEERIFQAGPLGALPLLALVVLAIASPGRQRNP